MKAEQYVEEFKSIILNVTKILKREVDFSKINIKVSENKGEPAFKWKDGYMYIYTFLLEDNDESEFLKIGKAGPKSKARYTYQHYNSKSSRSCLAHSILSDCEFCSKHKLIISDDERRKDEKSNETIRKWIKDNCQRIDIEIPYNDIFLLELIEASLHYKYTPKYEGYDSQRDSIT